jgi:Carboxypeptidase regulatory-like domain
MFNRHLTFTALATVAAICTAFGQSGVVSGTVRGADGKPAQGAQIRFEGKERSNLTTTTDAHGKYAYKGLPPGIYKISVLINGTPKSSATVKTAAAISRVDFDLKASPAKSVKHYVWVPPRTGSHMGGGWMEVDSNERPVAGTLNIDQGSAQAVQDMQRNMGRGQVPTGGGP